MLRTAAQRSAVLLRSSAVTSTLPTLSSSLLLAHTTVAPVAAAAASKLRLPFSNPTPSHSFHVPAGPLFQQAAVAENEEEATPVHPSIRSDAGTGVGKNFPDGYIAPHPGLSDDVHHHKDSYWLMQPVYAQEYVESIHPTHKPPKLWHEKAGYYAVQFARTCFDKATGYPHNMDERKWLRRMLFLETVAGVPGMVAGMLRHMRSLRTMKRDHGWIHTLLEEAENERMHLLTFLELRKPGPIFSGMVLMAQGVFFNAYFVAYLLSPKACHAFVGYLEEEAVKTYTHAVEEIKEGKLPMWSELDAPLLAKRYWKLKDDAKILDVMLAVRADEACHSHVNHTFSAMRPDQDNPFSTGNHAVPITPATGM